MAGMCGAVRAGHTESAGERLQGASTAEPAAVSDMGSLSSKLATGWDSLTKEEKAIETWAAVYAPDKCPMPTGKSNEFQKFWVVLYGNGERCKATEDDWRFRNVILEGQEGVFLSEGDDKDMKTKVKSMPEEERNCLEAMWDKVFLSDKEYDQMKALPEEHCEFMLFAFLLTARADVAEAIYPSSEEINTFIKELNNLADKVSDPQLDRLDKRVCKLSKEIRGLASFHELFPGNRLPMRPKAEANPISNVAKAIKGLGQIGLVKIAVGLGYNEKGALEQFLTEAAESPLLSQLMAYYAPFAAITRNYEVPEEIQKAYKAYLDSKSAKLSEENKELQTRRKDMEAELEQVRSAIAELEARIAQKEKENQATQEATDRIASRAINNASLELPEQDLDVKGEPTTPRMTELEPAADTPTHQDNEGASAEDAKARARNMFEDMLDGGVDLVKFFNENDSALGTPAEPQGPAQEPGATSHLSKAAEDRDTRGAVTNQQDPLQAAGLESEIRVGINNAAESLMRCISTPNNFDARKDASLLLATCISKLTRQSRTRGDYQNTVRNRFRALVLEAMRSQGFDKMKPDQINSSVGRLMSSYGLLDCDQGSDQASNTASASSSSRDH